MHSPPPISLAGSELLDHTARGEGGGAEGWGDAVGCCREVLGSQGVSACHAAAAPKRCGRVLQDGTWAKLCQRARRPQTSSGRVLSLSDCGG